MRTTLQLVATVFVSMTMAVVGLWVVQSIVPAEVLRANNEVAGNYLQSLGTIYAVLLAFVVFVVWSQYNETSHTVEREADELADVLRFVRLCREPARSRMLETARDFAREQIDIEWPSLARGAASVRAGQLLDAFWQALAGAELSNARDEVLYPEALYAEAISRFNEACDARTDLIQSSHARLPVTMWMLVVSGGCSTVASMYLFGLERFWPLAVMTASLAGCVSFVLYVIYDLDNPFAGDWQVSSEPIRLLLEQIERDRAAPTK